MNKYLSGLLNVVMIVVIVWFGVSVFSEKTVPQAQPVLGGYDMAYNSTTTPSISGAMLMVKTGQGLLHTVVIGVTSATTFELRNATSTTDVASTTLLSMAASPVIGSDMILDVAFDRGLAIVFPASFTGRYTITYK